MDIPQFKNKADLIDFLVENKGLIIQEKKAAIHKSDAISFAPSRINEKGEAVKAESVGMLLDANALKVDLVINTTNLMDSHRDVHFRGIWTKSLKEQKNLYLLQEHKMEFATIISDQVKASARLIEWSELGYNYEGKTQALMFKATIEKGRNEFMFDQYARGYVKNHSVGMRYVKIALATSDDRYSEELAVWNKYFDQIANKEEAEQIGYFWAVTEAKIIEGSAVPMGSNFATPTLSVEAKQDNEPSKDTQKDEPTDVTQKHGSKGSNILFY